MKKKSKDFITLKTMRTEYLISLFCFFSLISGCANYLYKLDEKKWDKNLIVVKNPPLCENFKSKYNFFGENKDSVAIINEFFQQKFANLNLEEAAVLWSLIQLKIRPDLFNPMSRLQIFKVKNDNPEYYDFSSSNKEASPLLHGLNTFLAKNGSKFTLSRLSRMLLEYESIQIPIGDGFSEFIQAKKSELKNNPIFYRNYFKAGLEIRKGESLPTLSYTNMLDNIYKIKDDKEYIINTLLFSGNQSNYSYACNFDLNLYKKGIYLISEQPHPESWSIGISDQNGNHIFVVAGNTFKGLNPIQNSYFITPELSTVTTPKKFCFIKNQKNKMTIISTKGRDPAQHLYHIMNYDILNSDNLKEAQEYINFPRHLFLQNPNRMLYESEKGSPEQLSNFLKLDFPLYHKQNLGLVYGHGNVLGKNSFLLDHRGPAVVSCQ
ncbi:MAG: hypothetical protein EP319_12465 [Deltaproteobacteria bacterium]|nr:MAG: hypothetical protein EP319_12465 [Deltaproteobacteria bacterium]